MALDVTQSSCAASSYKKTRIQTLLNRPNIFCRIVGGTVPGEEANEREALQPSIKDNRTYNYCKYSKQYDDNYY